MRSSEQEENNKVDNKEEDKEEEEGIVVVCWLINVPATCKCISGTELLRQLYVPPH